MILCLKKLVLPVILLFTGSVCSQYREDLVFIEKEINSGRHIIALSDLRDIDTERLSPGNKAFFNYLMALCLEYNNNEDKAYEHYMLSRQQYLSIDSISKAMEINLDLAYMLSSQKDFKNSHNTYIQEYLEYVKKLKSPEKTARGYIQLASSKIDTEEYTESLSYFKEALKLIKESKNLKLESQLYNNVAALYNENLNKPDSALYYLRKDLDIIKTVGSTEDLCYNYINQAASFYYMGNHKKAIEYLIMADNLPIKKYTLRTKQYIYEFLYKNYEALNDLDSAYKYILLNKKLADSINENEQNIAINDIQTKYNTKEINLKNKLLKEKDRKRGILMYTLGGLLIACLIIGFLIIKNARRKEKITLQEKLIEQQKLEKALKDYELNSIDLMLEGQERERQRIANDLHDNLGSMLATLKLNFENLKLRKNELRDEENKLYERTDELIEEAYQKVRRMAHAKNAGVFANEGLIPAIKKLADKMAIPGKLNFDVIDFGFNERLENTVEIAIFRMIQELATNIIKHSEATEATMHLTHHENNINIIIEDNGVGLVESTLNKADGMGLSNIKAKIKQMDGSFQVDSTPGKGTTIIIDIPI